MNLLELRTGSGYNCYNVGQALDAQQHGGEREKEKYAAEEDHDRERPEKHGGGGALAPGARRHDLGSRRRGENPQDGAARSGRRGRRRGGAGQRGRGRKRGGGGGVRAGSQRNPSTSWGSRWWR